jgi:hypothetical protein
MEPGYKMLRAYSMEDLYTGVPRGFITVVSCNEVYASPRTK